MAAIKARLDTGLTALNAAVEGNTAFAAAHLRELSGLCQALMASPVSGDAAFAAVRSLARCMPPPLGQRSLLLAGSLRLVGLAARGTQGISYDSIPERSAVAEVVGALHASTVPARAPLPGPSYALVFPVVAAVLHCPVLSPLHDAALGVLALHASPEQDIPRGESLELLYHLLGLIPAYRCEQRGLRGGVAASFACQAGFFGLRVTAWAAAMCIVVDPRLAAPHTTLPLPSLLSTPGTVSSRCCAPCVLACQTRSCLPRCLACCRALLLCVRQPWPPCRTSPPWLRVCPLSHLV